LAIHVEGNIKPYKVGRVHQHVPEMEQEISGMLKKRIDVTFVPHLASFKYGILSTHYLTLKKSYKWEDINSAYKEMYQDEPFIRLMPDNKTFPEVMTVEGTNFCDIGFVPDEGSKACVVISTIDNMIKGAAGQAVQNMNVMHGFEETEGLPYGKVLRKSTAARPLSLIRNN
jgi:N-acetyl-gamma-glutamyl-phosphate reductase